LHIFGASQLADNFADRDFDSTKPTSKASRGVCGGCQPLRYSNDISRFYLVRNWGSNASNIHLAINGNHLSGDQCLGDRASIEHGAINRGCGISFEKRFRGFEKEEVSSR